MEAAGTPLRAMDTLIDVQAIVLKATLLTNDQATRRVPGLMDDDRSGGWRSGIACRGGIRRAEPRSAS
jgi:hypothetical protein